MGREAGRACWPGAQWDKTEALDEQGWSLRCLTEAFRYPDTIDASRGRICGSFSPSRR